MAVFPIPVTETNIFPCPRCGGKNRIFLYQAFQNPGQVRCGSCQSSLLAGKENHLVDLQGSDYQHPLDKQSLKALESIPGITTILKKIVEVTLERYDHLFHQSSYLQVSPKQLPNLLRTFEKSAYSLGLNHLPELYVYQSPEVNAFTGGVERPYVAVSSTLCEMMEEDELGAVLGHELSHWQSKHVLYKIAARIFSFAAGELAKYTLGLGNLVALPLQLALLKWDRCSELTADRGMVLCTKDPVLSLRVLMKLSGVVPKFQKDLSLESFMEQAISSWKGSEEGILDKVYTLLQTMSQSHPFPLWRAAELWTWVCEGEYLALLQKHASVS